MFKKIYYCKNCNKTYSDYAGNSNTCPSCSAPLMQTSVSDDEWHTKTDEEKNAIKMVFSEQYKAQAASGELVTSDYNRGKKNFIGMVLSIIGWCPTVIGLIAWVMIVEQDIFYDYSGVIGFLIFIICFLSGVFILGFAEIIHLLQGILDK